MHGGRAGGSRSSRVVLLVAPALTSCSLLFVQAPPPRPPKTGAVECTTSVAAPAIDALVAALQVLRVFHALSQDDSDYDGFPISRGADVGLGVAFAAIFGGSSAYGFRQTSACTALERRRERRDAVRAAWVGCTRDDQCKGDRVCEAGSCVRPGASTTRLPDPQHVPAPNGPAGAFGHDYGTTLEDAREACTAGGGVLTATGTSLFECRLTTPPRGDAPVVNMRFCGDVLCEVDALYPVVPASFHAWGLRYDHMERSLKRQLGPHVERRRPMTSTCANDYPSGFSAESPDFSTLWRWPNGSQVWLRSTPEGMVLLTFTGATASATTDGR